MPSLRMPTCGTVEVDLEALIEAIASDAERAASGPIAGLRAVREGDAIVLHGDCRTYHASQLAAQVARDRIEGAARLVNQIIIH